jgi:peptidyl-prolyl cis-trans isomerase A (cyclophilin A)
LIVALSRRAAATVLAGLLVSVPAWAQQEGPRVKLGTSAGDIVVVLFQDKAPRTVENFLQYVRDKHYDGTVFHRVIDGFMIQGGGFSTDMQQKPTRAPIALETRPDLKNDRGTLAMARTANPNSATAQFFITVADTRNLDAPMPDGHGYAVFGRVVQGMDVVDKIKGMPTGRAGPMQNVPATPIVIQSATLLK